MLKINVFENYTYSKALLHIITMSLLTNRKSVIGLMRNNLKNSFVSRVTNHWKKFLRSNLHRFLIINCHVENKNTIERAANLICFLKIYYKGTPFL